MEPGQWVVVKRDKLPSTTAGRQSGNILRALDKNARSTMPYPYDGAAGKRSREDTSGMGQVPPMKESGEGKMEPPEEGRPRHGPALSISTDRRKNPAPTCNSAGSSTPCQQSWRLPAEQVFVNAANGNTLFPARKSDTVPARKVETGH
eukprot:12476600-Heterocapsa_arctica.AAC.1